MGRGYYVQLIINPFLVNILKGEGEGESEGKGKETFTLF